MAGFTPEKILEEVINIIEISGALRDFGTIHTI